MAYLDPQERVWGRRQSGMLFSLSELQGTDVLAPLEGIEGFSSSLTKYSHTLFRFPLRKHPSDLSHSMYTVDSLIKLVDALRDEAKFLLLFLRCVHTVEVYNISSSIKQPVLYLQVRIAPEHQATLSKQRASFLSELKSKHKLSKYNIAPCISSVSAFTINITDIESKQSMKSITWLVANQVGSSKRDILDAAKRQLCFPWVGVAMELHDDESHVCSGAGRVFCFLPMPIETTSKLPVHVNGTFGLNDDRRTIKWPGGERRNDPTAQWNQMLVTECLPPCYNKLLKTAVKDHKISTKLLYHAWPNIHSLWQTPWNWITVQFFQLLFQWECLWAQRSNQWVRMNQAVAISDSDTIAEVVWRVLTACGVQLCGVPDHVLEVLHTFGVQQLSPALACNTLRHHIFTYQREGYSDKLDLLRFCLHEMKNFSMLHGLELLPMANGTFVSFNCSGYATNCYICSKDFPRKLLPNIDDKLVDLLGIDDDLHSQLTEVASCTPACTQLRVLSVPLVASLLPQCYPPGWLTTSVLVSRRSRMFPYDWWTTFWKWVQQQAGYINLSLFVNQYVVPLITSNEPDSMYVTKLSKNSAVIVMENSDICSSYLLNAFKKLQVQCVSMWHFPHMRHWQLQNYLNRFSPSGVLTAVMNSGCQINTVSFTHSEAKELQRFLISENITYLSNPHKQILINLCIFTILNNDSLMSILEASQMSWKRHAILEPYSFTFSSESLPSNLVILSCTKNESELIRICTSVSYPDNMMRFLLDELFPMIQVGSCPEDKIDTLMEHVLCCQFPVLRVQWGNREFINQLTNLPFIRCVEYSNTRKAPCDLYDCSDDLLKDIFQEMPVFPLSPFNTREILQYLRQCNLKTTVSGQQLYDLLDGAASVYSDHPQQAYKQRLAQVNAILSYINKNEGVLRETTLLKGGWNYITLLQALQQFSKNWLPVCFAPPARYPECLLWKGNGYSHHFVSHKSRLTTVLCTSNNLEHLSCIAGSQMYFVECPDVLCKELGLTLPIASVFNHFSHLVSKKHQFSSSSLDKLVHHIYIYLTQNLSQVQLYWSAHDLSRKTLIWLKKKHKFSAPKEIVLHQRASFPHSLAPFYEIAENGDDYVSLFNLFGVKHELSDSDIISVLRKIRDDGGHHVSSQDAWKMVEYILNWIAEHNKIARIKLTETLLVPIQSNSDRPQLVDIDKVAYTDLKFLKSFKQAGAETYFIHEKIVHLAASLGVKPLSRHLNVSHDAFGDVGQHEPLITRLRSILKDYKDGLTIIKELLQNADDAGATEVTICYDARTHVVDTDSLLYRGMSECHGPALLVHNNATFTDEDFENITKLDAATKEDKPLKIGKFGLGFCSVYHITDIPSFISGKWLYIFDPIIKYLGEEISDRSRPGKKLSFTEEIVHESQQLVPYKGLFKFDQNKPYSGTLFRLPFRTSASEISSDIYDESRIQSLLSDLKKAGSKLLLFLNNLESITFSQIDVNYKKLFTIEKKGMCDSQLKAILPRDTQLLTFCNGPNDEEKYTDELWLVASRRENINKPAIAAVACLMEKTGTHYIPQHIDGETFCYLPLTLQTGLPLHVSANFAVLKDRTGIRASDSWNILLMRIVIPKAYYSLLLALKQLCTNGKISTNEYIFYSMWPLRENLKSHNPWNIMIPQLYSLLTNSELFYSACTRKWLKLKSACILAESVLLLPSCKDNSRTLCKVLEELNYSLIKLPCSYQNHLGQMVIRESTIYEEQFLSIFFENINKVELCTETRNKVLFIIFQVCATNSKDYINQHLTLRECVPCTPNGLLRKCSQTIDPCASFSKLFDNSDEMFPMDDFHSNDHVHIALTKLGIIRHLLPWNLILERAKMIQSLYETDQVSSMKRVAYILQCIKEQIESRSESEPEISRQLVDVAFLPVMRRPRQYPESLTWYGDKYILLSGQELIKGEDNAWLAGSQACIVAESEPKSLGCGRIPSSAATFLKIKSAPSCNSVVNHLLQIVDLYSSKAKFQRDDKKKFIEDTCEKIFKHLELILTRDQIYTGDLEKLKHTQSVWTGKKFISPQSIAKSWNQNGPFLYSIPHLLVGKEKLIASLGIQDDFTVEQYVKALEDVHDSYSGQKITDDRELSTLADIASKLADKLDETSKSLAYKACYLPDKDGIMRKANNLAYNDAQWCKMDEGYHGIHYKITRHTAEKLGVDLVRSKALQRYESSMQNWDGVPFGQGEKLTQRIQNILSDYPWNITVLKELLQNADDARATKMYVILDKRTHGKYKIFSTEWKDLQGPALLVWNDCGFSENDFEGIQKLGLGSKRSNADTIGQYGIGFNVVYHLTDCPSFFTNGDTLCVLDPHCRYVLGADAVKPGRRYDGVDDKFWNNWSDMKSTYLRDCNSSLKCPEEIAQGKGTLFRFPLRHTSELVRKSKITNGDGNTLDSKPVPLTAWKLERELKEWAPKMKEALLFLNNVTELKFFVISTDSTNPTMVLTHHFEAQLESSEVAKRNDFLHKARHFSADSQAFVVHYPLCLAEREPRKEEESWLIQQGVGDIHNPQQYWQYLSHIKPVHGIAARIKRGDFVHRIFCFLPLPLETRLPVHVNGKFVLDAARSELWQSRETERSDDKHSWNLKLIEAIASSYVDFLVNCRKDYISSQPYEMLDDLWADIRKYYSLFPRWDIKQKPEKEMHKLALEVYKRLSQCNSEVLAVLSKSRDSSKEVSSPGSHSKYSTIEILPLIEHADPSKQAYFWDPKDLKVADLKAVPHILKKIGIQLTAAPMFIREHLAQIDEPDKLELLKATPETVYDYYCSYHKQVARDFPCSIVNSAFKSVNDFMKFIKYVIQVEHLPDRTGTFFKFPKPPVGIPLLLTADEMLRQFSEDSQVISSNYSDIFSQCKEMFLHSAMYKETLIPSYFLQPSKDDWVIISNILERTLPKNLAVVRLKNASNHIDIQGLLSPLWRCLNEEVFCIHIQDILKSWALLLSKENELFSLIACDELIPLIPPHRAKTDTEEENASKLNEEVFQIMEGCKMPILNTEVVSVPLCKKFCPQINEHQRVLQNLYHMFKYGELQSLLLDIRTLDNKIETLFTYFGKIHFAREPVHTTQIKSLPLFKNIDNSYCSLLGKAFIWPNNICLSGRDVWMRQVNQTVTFLRPGGVWTKLGEASVLGIMAISPLSLYMRFIFPHFQLFSDEEREQHLQYIRDSPELFNKALHDSKADNESEEKIEGALFIAALKRLPCLAKNGTLKPICQFCHPSTKVFTLFLESYEFPPKKFQDTKWLLFFSHIGLRQKVTQEEFLAFCQKIVNGDHSDVLEASKSLLDYLFKEDQWHYQADFLKQVSKVAFVSVDLLKDLAWIVPVAEAENIIQKDKKKFCLTPLSKAASYDARNLIWSVMPVIHLPSFSREHYQLDYSEKLKKCSHFLRCTGVCTEPKSEDIVQNLLNISCSRFSNIDLFDRYTMECKARKGKESLLFDVVFHCLDNLRKTIQHTPVNLTPLKGVPCIPVCSNGNTSEKISPVLVPPIQVIAYHSDDIRKLVPFLNPLNNCFYPVLHDVLMRMGVQNELCYENIRYALEVMHKHVKQPLFDINCITAIKILLKKLYQTLSLEHHYICSGNLYLPSQSTRGQSRHLVESTKLLFNDKDSYGDIDFNLSGLPYSFMSLMVNKFEELNEYNFRATEFYFKLPGPVRPLLLSTQCVEKLSCSCNADSELTDFTKKLKQAFKFPDFANVTMLMIQGSLSSTDTQSYTETCTKFSQAIGGFCNSVRVYTVANLKVDVYLTLTNPPAKIGTAKVDYLLERESCSLYIDSEADALTIDLFESLTSSIVSCAADMGQVDCNSLVQPERAVGFLLRGPNSHQIKQMLHKQGIKAKYEPTGRTTFNFTPKLGEAIPEELHHRLKFDLLNVFRPQEWVAYADKDDHFIYARIEYYVQRSSDADSQDEFDEELGRYHITVSEEDETGKDVSIVELRKFLLMKEVCWDDGSRELVLYDPESEGVQLWDAIKDDKLESVLKQIYQELRKISSIKDKDLRRKAIKAMILKWHPDKNPSPFATNVFQYLWRQAKRMLNGLPPENPEAETSDDIQDPSTDEELAKWYSKASTEGSYCQKEKSSGDQSSSNNSALQVLPDTETAKVWLEQAQYDLLAAQNLLKQSSSEKNICAHVCFLAHQVAEKALKAGMYGKFGLHPTVLRWHQLVGHARAIEQHISSASGLEKLASTLETYYLKTRYPNVYHPPSVPSSYYHLQQAGQAECTARMILEIIQNIIP